MIRVKKQVNSGPVYKKMPRDIIFTVINITMFALFSLVCFLPFYYLFINTISDNELVTRGMITFWPKGIHFSNYAMLRHVNDFFNSLLITLSRTVFGTGTMIIVSSFTGYLVTKRKMWHRKFWYRFIIIPMYFNAGLIPWYTTMLSLGLTNNYLAYILPGLVVPFNIILVKTYIESIPKDIEESAAIDGAGTMTTFIRIIWPLCVPIIATIAIFGAVANWNSFQDSLILMQGSSNLHTLQHKLFIYLTSSNNLESMMNSGLGSSGVESTLSPRIVQFTIAMVSIIPILALYPFMQRFFVKGIMMGAVKG